MDKAIAAFAVAYADQNEKDHAALARAIRKGTVKAEFEDEPVKLREGAGRESTHARVR
jgi:hypothetical protein